MTETWDISDMNTNAGAPHCMTKCFVTIIEVHPEMYEIYVPEDMHKTHPGCSFGCVFRLHGGPTAAHMKCRDAQRNYMIHHLELTSVDERTTKP